MVVVVAVIGTVRMGVGTCTAAQERERGRTQQVPRRTAVLHQVRSERLLVTCASRQRVSWRTSSVGSGASCGI